jgi:dTDP-4-amino-4,6-dideoxygalactose transaminase
MVERAEIIRDKGTNRSQFFRGEVDKYTWVDIGSSYVPSEICCAFLYAQLEALEVITEQRRTLHERYHHQLTPLEEQGLLRLPHIPEECVSNYHLFYILLNNQETRNALMAHLKQHGIHAVFHYIPLHSSPMGNKFGYCASDLPITEELSGRLLRLPFYSDMTEREQGRVVSSITTFFETRGH